MTPTNGANPDAEPEARNVVEALLRVMRDLPAISKAGRADPSQGGYAYRGIEQITSATQGLFARHGVLLVPRVTSHEVVDITVNSKPWTDTRLTVEYDAYGPGGVEDKIVIGPLVGIGRDNSDKGANKCMSQAFKYALLQVLCIADSKDDADGTTTEADAGSRAQRRDYRQARDEPTRGPAEEPTAAGNSRRGPRVLEGWADIEEQRGAMSAIRARADSLGVKTEVAHFMTERGYGSEVPGGWPLTRAQHDEVTAWLDERPI